MRYDLVRSLRKAKGYTLVEFGELTGYTPSFISQIERGLKEPSLEAMRKLADCLDISVISFLEETPEVPSDFSQPVSHCTVIRSDKRHTFSLDAKGTKYEMITPRIDEGAKKHKMNGMYTTIAPHSSSNIEPISHFYEECCIILSGKMRAFVEGKTYDLGVGDSLYIESYAMHNYINEENEPLILVNFQSQ